jgi:phosphatidylglycerophosphate synthase
MMQPDRARPDEIEPWTNRAVVHRLSVLLLPLAIRSGISPNLVSVAGLLFGAAAAFAYMSWRSPMAAVAGFLLMIAWHVCDGLDGKLARATGRTSDLGRVLDGICDYATFIFVYLALALTSEAPLAMLLLAIAAGGAHALTSLHYEAERAIYIARADGRAAPVAQAVAIERGYLDLQTRVTRGSAAFDAAASPAVRQAYARAARPLMKLLSFESANTRTILIFLTALAGTPWLFWLIELTILPLLAWFVAGRLRTLENRLIAAA